MVALNYKRNSEIISVIGLLLVVGSYFILNERMGLPGVPTLMPVIGTAMILLFARDTRVGKFLSWRPYVGIGVISYSLYLWHQPVLVAQRAEWGDGAPGLMLVSGTCLSIALAAFSWKFVEKPFRHKAWGPTADRNTIILSLAVAAAAAISGLAIWKAQGLPSRFRPLAEPLIIPSRETGHCFLSFTADTHLEASRDLITCPLGKQKSGPRILLFGDSYAGHFEPFLERLANRFGYQVTAVTTNWCHPSDGAAFRGPRGHVAYEQCQLNRMWVREHMHEYDVVMLGGTWGALANDGLLGSSIDYVRELAGRGVPLIILSTPYQHNQVSVEHYAYGIQTHLPVANVADRRQRDSLQKVVNAAKGPSVFVLTREMLFDAGAPAPGIRPDGKLYSADGGHMSVAGSYAAAEHFLMSDDARKMDGFIRDARQRREEGARPSQPTR